MQVLKFVTMDDKKVTCWCTTDTLKGFRDFMQYMLDNCFNPEKFMVWDTKSDKVYYAFKIATEQYGMRKRTFAERINNTQTGKWMNIVL